MFDQKSADVLKQYLTSDECPTSRTFDWTLGMMTCILSCPRLSTETNNFEIDTLHTAEQLILGNLYNQLANEHSRLKVLQAWSTLCNYLENELLTSNFNLVNQYKVFEQDAPSLTQLIRWCNGYLSGCVITKTAWDESLDLMRPIPDYPDAKEFIEQLDEQLRFLTEIGQLPEQGLEQKTVDATSEEVMEVSVLIDQSALLRYEMGVLLEELQDICSSHKMKTGPTYKVPYTREQKIGRNDPCSCGSGKKYKKCCGR
ncbi:MAG: hypothetical protein ACI8WB_001206 [Phenylobacterium sp.]|jgi:uncharacterized protein YecA (UPF0149 family)